MTDDSGYRDSPDLTPRQPEYPLLWDEFVLELLDRFPMTDQPVYVVGGAVRDAYLHRPVKDLDLVTPTGAIKLARLLAGKLNGDVYVLDMERDVARVLLPRHDPLTGTDDIFILDVAGFRGVDLAADLFDRDFTLNAMAVEVRGDPGRLIDPTGGEADLKLRRVRRCSPTSVGKDVIRGMRAVRQSVQLRLRIEAATLEDIRTHAPRLMETSGERVRDELMNIMGLAKAPAALRILERVGLLAAIFPELAARFPEPNPANPLQSTREHTLLVVEKLNNLLTTLSYARTDNTAANFENGLVAMRLDRYRKQLNQHIATVHPGDRPHRALLVLAALLHESDDLKLLEHYADTLRLSNIEKQRLLLMIRRYRDPVFEQPVDRLTAHRFWYTCEVGGIDVILLALAHYPAEQGVLLHQDAWLQRIERVGVLLEAYFDRHHEIVAPPPLLDGNLLRTRLDLKPGPVIGELLTLIREGQAAGTITTLDEALAAAEAHLRGDAG